MPLPTVILPGYFARGTDYSNLEQSLRQQGIPTATVSLKKRDWLPTLGGRSVMPILRQIDRTVKQLMEESGSSQVNLIGHSAGGWIARIYLGEKPYNIHGDVGESESIWKANSYVNSLITLGTPHSSQERWTKRNLEFVNHNYPGAFYPEVRYICVAGKAIYGENNFRNWLAYSSYQLTCGKGNTWGDGITPIESAHLEGATNLIFEGVKHSPNSTGIWYGSAEILSDWVFYLLK